MKDNDVKLLEEAYLKTKKTQLNEGPAKPITLDEIVKQVQRGLWHSEEDLNTYLLQSFKNGYFSINEFLEYLGMTQGDVFENLTSYDEESYDEDESQY